MKQKITSSSSPRIIVRDKLLRGSMLIFAAAALTFTLVACDDSSSASNTTGLDKDKASFENDDVENTDSDEDLDSDEDSDADEDFDTEESSDSVESSDSNESSASEDDSSSSLDDNSSSSMGISSSSNNSSSSAEETCKHVSDVDGGTCQDGDVVKDCATDAYAVCRNNGWTPAIIGGNCRPIGDAITVNDMIKLTCNEDSYWEYIPVYNNCPPGNYSCQPPNYGCLTHPINGFSCNERNNKVYQLTVTTRASGECMYLCDNGKYGVVVDVAPVGN